MQLFREYRAPNSTHKYLICTSKWHQSVAMASMRPVTHSALFKRLSGLCSGSEPVDGMVLRMGTYILHAESMRVLWWGATAWLGAKGHSLLVLHAWWGSSPMLTAQHCRLAVILCCLTECPTGALRGPNVRVRGL